MCSILLLWLQEIKGEILSAMLSFTAADSVTLLSAKCFLIFETVATNKIQVLSTHVYYSCHYYFNLLETVAMQTTQTVIVAKLCMKYVNFR